MSSNGCLVYTFVNVLYGYKCYNLFMYLCICKHILVNKSTRESINYSILLVKDG